jgi:hypothetical protein
MAGTTNVVKRNWGKTLAQHISNAVLDPLFAFYTQINNLVTDVETARRVLNVNTTAVGNVGAGVDNLMSYQLAASKLATAGGAIRIRGWGTAANNATAKNLLLKFGTASLLGTLAITASQVGKWYVDAIVTKTGTDTQDFVAVVIESVGTTLAAGKQAQLVGTATEDDGAAITIQFQGEGGADNDVVQEGMIVEFIPTATELVASALSDTL